MVERPHFLLEGTQGGIAGTGTAGADAGAGTAVAQNVRLDFVPGADAAFRSSGGAVGPALTSDLSRSGRAAAYAGCE